MGEITIKIPQRIKKSFDINNRIFIDKILNELEERSAAQQKPKPARSEKLAVLSEFMKKYRSEPDAETSRAIEIAEEWRKRWDR